MKKDAHFICKYKGVTQQCRFEKHGPVHKNNSADLKPLPVKKAFKYLICSHAERRY